MKYQIEYEQEVDGRWIAEIQSIPGVMAYGNTLDEAISKAQILALRVLADKFDNGEYETKLLEISFSTI